MNKNDLYKYDPKTLSYKKVKKNSFFEKLSKVLITSLGLIATVVTIYAFFFNEEKSNLEYQIISDVNVLDLKEDVSKLDIFYDSLSLKKADSNLKIYTIKLINNGNKEVLIEHFDERSPLGIDVKNGKIVEKPELIECSNKYLRDYFRTNLINNKKLEFNKLIFEPNEFLIFKFLVLHDRKDKPLLLTLGKIAGQKTIKISKVNTLKNQDNFIEVLFYGNILIHIIRAILFLILWVVIFIVLVYFFNKMNNFKNSKKRKKIVEDFKQKNDYNFQAIHNIIFDRYIREGDMFIYEYGKIILAKNNSITILNENIIEIFKNYSLGQNDIIDNMISEGYLLFKKNTLKFNESLVVTLMMFYQFLGGLEDYNLGEFSFSISKDANK